MTPSPLSGTLRVLCVAAALLALSCVTAAAAVPRLVLSSKHGVSVTVGASSDTLVSGLQLTNAGGDFVLHATRTHGRIVVAQDGGRTVASVLATRRRPYTLDKGLPNAFAIVLSQRGRVVARLAAPWCPRLGLRIETPPSCGDPLSRRVIWTVTHGQVLDIALAAPAAGKLRPGRYAAVVRFDPGGRLLHAGGPVAWRGTTLVSREFQASGGTPEAPTAKQRGTPPTFADQPTPATNLAGAYLPDLLPLPAEQLTLFHDRHRDTLHFASDVADAGADLTVDGTVGAGDPPGSMDAVQVVAGPAGPLLHPAGHLVFDNDDGHDHWHFFDLAHYRIVRVGDGKTVRVSTKIGFCFGDTAPFDLTVAGAPLSPIQPPLHVGSCEHKHPDATSVHMTLDAGWLDQYEQSLAGQAFDVTKLPNGRYAIVIDVNPRGILAESDRSNDSAARPFTLGGRRGHRTIAVPPVDGVYTEPSGP